MLALFPTYPHVLSAQECTLCVCVCLFPTSTDAHITVKCAYHTCTWGWRVTSCSSQHMHVVLSKSAIYMDKLLPHQPNVKHTDPSQVGKNPNPETHVLRLSVSSQARKTRRPPAPVGFRPGARKFTVTFIFHQGVASRTATVSLLSGA